MVGLDIYDHYTSRNTFKHCKRHHKKAFFFLYWKLNLQFQEGGLFIYLFSFFLLAYSFNPTSLFQSQGLSRGFFGTACVCLCLGSYCMPWALSLCVVFGRQGESRVLRVKHTASLPGCMTPGRVSKETNMFHIHVINDGYEIEVG